MHSKSHKKQGVSLFPVKRRNKSAYWRGEKAMIFFRRSVLFLCFFIFLAVIVLGVKFSSRLFPIKNILISGNYQLREQEIRNRINIKNDESLLNISLRDVNKRLKALPWVKNVSIRKQFPNTLMLRIEEAVPKALLKYNNSLFLIDVNSNIIEEIKGGKALFLPVITGINPKNNRGDILEALKLTDALAEKDMLSTKESIEIKLMPYGLAMNMDGEVVKVGYGRYGEKLKRWKELEAEIRKRGIAIDYVDLRFGGQVIVKPLKKTSEKRS